MYITKIYIIEVGYVNTNLYALSKNEIIHFSYFLPDVAAEFIQLTNGKRLMIYKGYPFYKKHSSGISQRWCCSKGYCSSFLRITHEMTIIYEHLQHNHAPSKYWRTPDGTYAKIS